MATIKFDAALVEKSLAGVDYPAHKDTLIEAAMQNGAPQEVQDWLDGLTEREYQAPTEVMEELSSATQENTSELETGEE